MLNLSIYKCIRYFFSFSIGSFGHVDFYFDFGTLWFIDLLVHWFRDKSLSGHSVTLRETVAVTPAEIKGATAYEVSGMFRFLLLLYMLFHFFHES